MSTATADEIAIIFAALACEAGDAIMRARASGKTPRRKTDGSPVTQADLDADRCIRNGLKLAMPSVHVVTEEANETHGTVADGRFVLVDPLDGTREFIAGRDEFTVNIALIENGMPIVGAIYAPAFGRLYVAGESAWRGDVDPGKAVPELSAMHPIRAQPLPKDRWRAVVSHSHLDAQTQQWLASHAVDNVFKAGSSLKFCAVAEGAADVYPRLSATMEWDVAAGHALLAAAGGAVIGVDGEPLTYGKPGFRNPEFVAWGRRGS